MCLGCQRGTASLQEEKLKSAQMSIGAIFCQDSA